MSKLIDIEKVKIEINREFLSTKKAYNDFAEGRRHELYHLLQFLDTLPEENVEVCAGALLDALSKTPYNNKPITDAQVVVKELLVFLKEPNKYNPDAINQEDGLKFEGWVTRNADGHIFYHKEKPRKERIRKHGYWTNEFEMLPEDAFPEVTWEDEEPVEVELTIRKKSNS